MRELKFSVSMCVYQKDNAQWIKEAIESILNQTHKASEIVIVVDGPVPDTINQVIKRYEENEQFKVIRLPENQGHGKARQCGLENCSNELIALMDADDICVKDRFEQQIRFFEDNKVDIVGGNIAEFIGEPENIIAYRTVYCSDEEIKRDMKNRCPFNQVTVMFKKSSVLKAGGYIDWFNNEDYYLWIRMLLNGCNMKNTGTVLANVRVGNDMYQRRGGLNYFKSEVKLQRYMLNCEVIDVCTYLINVTKRFIVQVVLPNRIRSWVFKKFARKKV